MSAWWEEKDQKNEDFTMEDCNLLAEMLAAMIKGSTYSMSPEERAQLQKMIDVWGKRCPVPEPDTKPKPEPEPEPEPEADPEPESETEPETEEATEEQSEE